VRLCPPLVITEAEVAEGLKRMEGAFEEAFSKK
jgi:acetylornithine/succinyldiaminopimelate/putrescine aminotransferase